MKHPAGGRFDPAAPFLYFIAGSPERVGGMTHYDKGDHLRTDRLPIVPHPHVLVAVNEIRTAKDHDILDRLCDERDVLLDSGIFNLAMTHARRHNVSHDAALAMPPEEIDGFTELWENYATIATRYTQRLWGVIELDQGGVENKPRTRERIERELGFVPMPVYHPLLDGWLYYDRLAKGYDRICYGNLVKASPPVRLRLIYAASERARAYPHLWTHLLGVYPNENVLAMPLRGSCDSSSWLTSERWMPSWKGWSMGRMITHYPPPMWYSKGNHRRAAALNAITARSLADTLDTIGTTEPTHAWLAGHP